MIVLVYEEKKKIYYLGYLPVIISRVKIES
jgi:hypothetical protein